MLKTINMYTFKPAEVTALEEGGNKKARKYWLHFYDADNPREYRVDMEDPKSVLEFMKLKYEQKKCQHLPMYTAQQADWLLALPSLTHVSSRYAVSVGPVHNTHKPHTESSALTPLAGLSARSRSIQPVN